MQYGLDPDADAALSDILPTGDQATPLDLTVELFSPQLTALLRDLLLDLSTNLGGGSFLYLARNGQMMQYTGESLQRLEANLAGDPPESLSQLGIAGS